MIRFGPSGNTHQFYEDGNKKSTQAAAWLKKIGLDAYEYSFGRGLTLSVESAAEIGATCTEHDIAISVHAPYFINFAGLDPQKRENSFGYIIGSLARLKAMGGTRCVVHTAACAKLDRNEALDMSKESLVRLVDILRENGLYDGTKICLETMGKLNQIGTAEEIVHLCAIDPLYIPCFDFGHINSYLHGGLKTSEDYRRIIDTAYQELDKARVDSCHIHFSRIMYGPSGEIKHLNFEDAEYGPYFEPLARVLIDYHMTPTVICESAGEQSRDALDMQSVYRSLL